MWKSTSKGGDDNGRALPVSDGPVTPVLLPPTWTMNRAGDIATITTGAKNTQDKSDGGTFPFFVRSSTVERINSYSFDGEAVLTAGDGVGTGKVFHYINGKFDFHQRVYKISNFRESVDGYYFYLYFSTHFYDRIMSMTAKSSVDSVRMEMIADMPILLPPLPEQHVISAAVSDVQSLIAALNALIAKKRAIKQATMQQLLIGKTRLPGFEGEWISKRLGQFVSIRNEKILPKNVLPNTICVELEHIGHGTGRLVGQTDASQVESSKYRFSEGDVLFGRLRSYLRKFWHADCDGICSTEIWPLLVDSRQASASYLFQLVQTDSFINAAK